MRFLTLWHIGIISEKLLLLLFISAMHTFMFNISKLHGIKCLCNLLQLELCNVMERVITDIMRDCYEMWKIIVIAINFYNAKKIICTMMFFICNQRS